MDYKNDPMAETSVPNRCTYNGGTPRQCFRAVCRAKDGTWAILCQQHKDHFVKNGVSYLEQFVTGRGLHPTINEAELIKAIRKYKSAKRDWYLVSTAHTDLVHRYNELTAELERTRNAIDELDKIEDKVKRAKTEVDKFIDLDK